MNHQPVSPLGGRQVISRAHQMLIFRTTTHGYQQTIPATTTPFLFRILLMELSQLQIDPVCYQPQCQLPQGDKVAFTKKMRHRALTAFAQVNLALLESLQEILVTDINQDQFIGLLDEMIRYGLLNLYPGNLLDDFMYALQVLNIHGGRHGKTCVQQLIHILPTLLVARAGGVAVGKFVQQEQARAAGKGRIQVKLFKHNVFVRNMRPR